MVVTIYNKIHNENDLTKKGKKGKNKTHKRMAGIVTIQPNI